MKVHKVADIADGVIRILDKRKGGEFCAILTDIKEVDDPNPKYILTVEIEAGTGQAWSKLKLTLPPFIRRSDDLAKPIMLVDSKVVFFGS